MSTLYGLRQHDIEIAKELYMENIESSGKDHIPIKKFFSKESRELLQFLMKNNFFHDVVKVQDELIEKSCNNLQEIDDILNEALQLLDKIHKYEPIKPEKEEKNDHKEEEKEEKKHEPKPIDYGPKEEEDKKEEEVKKEEEEDKKEDYESYKQKVIKQYLFAGYKKYQAEAEIAKDFKKRSLM